MCIYVMRDDSFMSERVRSLFAQPLCFFVFCFFELTNHGNVHSVFDYVCVPSVSICIMKYLLLVIHTIF